MQFPTHQASKTPVTPRGQAPGANLSSFKRVSSYVCKNQANGISWQTNLSLTFYMNAIVRVFLQRNFFLNMQPDWIVTAWKLFLLCGKVKYAVMYFVTW